MYKKKLTFSGKINNFEKLMQQETYTFQERHTSLTNCGTVT